LNHKEENLYISQYIYFMDKDTEEYFRSRIEAEAKKGEIRLRRK
jgi:hypothetical protein